MGSAVRTGNIAGKGVFPQLKNRNNCVILKIVRSHTEEDEYE